MDDYLWLVVPAAGLAGGALLTGRLLGWLMIALVGCVPFLFGLDNPMEGDPPGVRTGAIFTAPYVVAVAVGWWVRALIRG